MSMGTADVFAPALQVVFFFPNAFRLVQVLEQVFLHLHGRCLLHSQLHKKAGSFLTDHQLHLRYQASNMEEKKWTCEICGAGFTRPSHLMHHQRSVHQGVTYPCGHCGQTFKNKATRDTHEESCGQKVQCPKCLKTFAPTFIEKHEKSCGLERQRHQCPLCQKTYSRERDMRKHQQTCPGPRPRPSTRRPAGAAAASTAAAPAEEASTPKPSGK